MNLSRIANSSLFIIVLSLLFAAGSFADDTDEEKTESIIVTFNYMATIEFAHSVDRYDFLYGNIGYEKMMEEWWSLRIDVQPLIYGAGTDESCYGTGLSGAWVAYLDEDKDFTPYFEFIAGVTFFNEAIPIADATRFNFQLGLGAGLDFPLNDVNSLLLGYRFAHMSNSNFGDRNPGINGHMFVFGLKHRF